MAQPVDVEVGDKVMIPSDRARDRDVEMDTIQTNSRYFYFSSRALTLSKGLGE
jgi:hypothetical protein